MWASIIETLPDHYYSGLTLPLDLNEKVDMA